MDLVQIRKHDPLNRNVEKGDHEELSPMAPPDAYAPPGEDMAVPYEAMHPLLQGLRDEHDQCTAQLKAFEDTLDRIATDGPDRAASTEIGRFFDYVESDVLPHTRLEEKVLFPLLAQRLRESGEHSNGPTPTTGVDVLEGEHLELIQLTAIVLNLFGLVGRLPERRSQQVVMESAIEHAKALVESLRLHMFREDHIAFSLAHKLITAEELDVLAAKARSAASPSSDAARAQPS